jgi:cyclase
LLLDGRGLVKTVKFKDARYVGDPINAIKIFNDKFVDEIIFLDISASRENRSPDFDYLAQICSECFIPFCYGGGIKSIDDAEKLFSLGVEKISLNTAVIKNPKLIANCAQKFGSQSIVVTVDVHKGLLGSYHVMQNNGKTKSDLNLFEYIKKVEELGAGEIVINSVDRDGTQLGYDVKLLAKIASVVTIPVIACGGAGSITDMVRAKQMTDISAFAAGSLFVFKGKHRAVLINYPAQSELKEFFIGE